ncbi:hypothetical protein EWM64_g6175 [Hericium alpestre]|uniref:Uncharacterized protein n=1 Tax=Hericium alpestre TaxID=135208 RepID=A0A4Y9ZUV1_9AGAM|nr:hypothetical protein EWM64_g6175 [Hericium alpestre]
MKDLLCVLYLLPQELKTFNAKASDVPALTNATLMAEFFRFESVQKWILMVLTTCAERAVGNDDHQILKAADLDVIYQVAARCESETLLVALENYWIFLIQRNVKASNPASAIALAERFGRRRFKGRAYYEYLVQLWPGSMEECQLSPEQVAILARGFYSLCVAWGEIRRGPEIKCFAKRQYRGKERVLSTAPADVLGRLRLMRGALLDEKETEIYGLLPSYSRMDILQAVGRAIRKVEDSLPSHFE